MKPNRGLIDLVSAAITAGANLEKRNSLNINTFQEENQNESPTIKMDNGEQKLVSGLIEYQLDGVTFKDVIALLTHKGSGDVKAILNDKIEKLILYNRVSLPTCEEMEFALRSSLNFDLKKVNFRMNIGSQFVFEPQYLGRVVTNMNILASEERAGGYLQKFKHKFFRSSNKFTSIGFKFDIEKNE